MGSSVIAEVPRPSGIVCHDAGGANQILAMLRVEDSDGVMAYMEGPAKAMWEKSFPNRRLSNNVSELLANARTLITGTGWASNLEYSARRDARARGIYSIAVLDHWTNYLERFVREGDTVLPDEMWVVDEYASEIAGRVFPVTKIRQVPDLYAEEQVGMILPLSSDTPNELVYLLEPIRSDWKRGEEGEFQALRYFFEQLPQLGLPGNTVIRLRSHPSDSLGKYDRFLTSKGPPRVVMDNGNLAEALSRARWVVGCQTYAMTLALKAGRTVYCSLPPWAPACKLPHRGLIHIKDMSGT
jgi:hypothetical protein